MTVSFEVCQLTYNKGAVIIIIIIVFEFFKLKSSVKSTYTTLE